MNFYNERLAPEMLCKLLHDVVPYRFHRPVIFSYGKRHMLRKHERSQGVTNHRHVWLNLEAIAWDGKNDICSIQAGIWRQMLFTGFHEFAHVACKNHDKLDERYEQDWSYHCYIEDQANAKANEWMAKVLANDGRLYQPKYLGIIDIVRRRKEVSLKTLSSKGSYFCGRLKDYRCFVTGGQLSISDVAHKLFGHSLFNAQPQDKEKKELDAIEKEIQSVWKLIKQKTKKEEKRAEAYSHKKKLEELCGKKWKLRRRPQQREKQRKFRLIHRCGDDLARIHTDHAGRRHHFWVWGDLPIIAQRLAE